MSGEYVCNQCRDRGEDFRVPADEIGAAIMKEHLRKEHPRG